MLAGIGALLGGVGGLLGFGTGIANSVMQNQQADDNLALSQESFEWNKNFQERNWQYQHQLNMMNRQDGLDLINRTMAREDNAVQRRAADLEAAGFSRHLAAGQGANASSFSMPSTSAAGGSALSAPQRAFTQLQLSNTVINDLVGVLEGVERVSKSNTERLLLQDQRNLIKAQIADYEANTGYRNTLNKREKYKSQYEEGKGLPMEMLTQSISGLSFTAPYGVLGDFMNALKQYASDTTDMIKTLSMDRKMSIKDRLGGMFRGLITNAGSALDHFLPK